MLRALITLLGDIPNRSARVQPLPNQPSWAWCVGAGVNGEHAVGLGSQAQYPTGQGSPRH